MRRHDYQRAKSLLGRFWDKPTTRKLELACRLYIATNDAEVRSMIVGFISNNRDLIRKAKSELTDIGLVLLANGHPDLAEMLFDAAYNGELVEAVNLAQSYLHQGKQVPSDLCAKLEAFLSTSASKTAAICCNIVLQNFVEAERELAELLSKSQEKRRELCEWPIIALLIDHIKDAELKAVVVEGWERSRYRTATSHENVASISKLFSAHTRTDTAESGMSTPESNGIDSEGEPSKMKKQPAAESKPAAQPRRSATGSNGTAGESSDKTIPSMGPKATRIRSSDPESTPSTNSSKNASSPSRPRASRKRKPPKSSGK
jgi:hypothetical protein